MKFTPTEWKIISHRLECDGVAEVLSDDGSFDYDAVIARCGELERGSEFSGSDIDTAILCECLEGCTFFSDIEDAVASDEMTKGEMLALFKAARSLEKKTGYAVNLM